MNSVPEIERNRHKIVVGVDDVAENVAVLKAYIEAAGYMFIGASSGKECLDLTARMAPRLILLDIEMPHMDGYETCSRLRKLHTLSRVPIAFLTANRTAEAVMRGIAAGGNDFIVKPFEKEKLLGRVLKWANTRV
jgi:two-component system OmpR family response regulator